MDKEAALKILNRIIALKLAGVVRYTHYALMVYGYNRITIVEWLQKQADKGLAHARRAGEQVTWLGGRPSLGIGALLETCTHEIGGIMRESLAHEAEALKAYHELLVLAKDKDIHLEEYAHSMIAAETAYQVAVNKMLRKPGQAGSFTATGR